MDGYGSSRNDSTYVMGNGQQIAFGIDRVIREYPAWKNRRIGIVTNDAAICADDASTTSRERLLAEDFELVRLFSPEHGISRVGADGHPVDDISDPITGLPIISLYGPRLQPTAEHFKNVELLLFDLPDIGTRFYTYIWTLSHVMEACAEAGCPLVVLDRPNPIGGELALSEGPMLDEECCSSFIGRFDIPIRHSLTIGELARLWAKERIKNVDLEVIPCSGLNRTDHWPDLGVPFIPTSPSMPSYLSALIYPGTGLFEATNVSVGRGTEFPFQWIGAPWLNPTILHQQLDEWDVSDSVDIRYEEKQPKLEPWKNQKCYGLRFQPWDAKSFKPVQFGLLLLSAVIETHYAFFRWKKYETNVNPDGNDHFQRLISRNDVEELFDEPYKQRNPKLKQITEESRESWEKRVGDILLYPSPYHTA